MYLPKTIVLDQFPEGMELHNFLEKVKHSTLTDTWPQIRRTLLDSRVPAIVESLRARLESAEVGLVNKVDLRAEEIRRASTKITDLPWDFEPLKQIKGIDALAREYLYMKHSSAVNGRNKGISKSALKRQFGFTLSECANIHFEHLCPSCGQMAEGSVDSLAEDIVKQYGFLTINCKHCGHSEEISAPNYYSDDHFTCKCEKCTFAAREAAQFVAEQLRGIGVKLAHSVTVEVKRVCDELQQIQSRRDSNADVSQESKIVASHLWQRPNDHLVDAIEVVRKRTRNSLRHYEFMVDAWNILVNLLKDGLVDVQMHAVDLSDQQMVLECLLCESRMLFRTSEKEKQKALVKASADMTRFLRGPILNKPTGMHEWLKAVNDLGLTRNWFELPVDFHWTLNTARLAEIAGVSSNNAGYKGNEELYLYLVTGYSGSLEKTPKEIESTFDLKDCYLANQQVDIARTIRNEEADPIRNKLKRRLLESAPEVIDNFESIEDAIRSQEFSKFDQLLPARCDRNLVASFCYWRLSKEVIGDDSGLTLGHISAAFKMQATPFRKRIEPVTIPWTCPKCGGTAHINDLRLNSKGGLGTAALKCTSCNHVEAIGERNALDCKCAACDILRSEYLGNVADAAKGCMESLVDSLLEYAKSSHKTALQHSPWFDGSQADIWMGYSKLRQAGHGPRKAAGALLSGTTLEHGFDCRVSPFWILAGSKAGVFDLGAVEHLDGDLARQFVTESILKDLRKTKGLEHVSSFEMFEQILASKDINLVEQAVNYYFRSPDNGMPLPYRWKATENPQKILALAQEANRLGLIPKHLAANTEWYDRSRHGVELAPEEVPAWGHKQT